MRTIALSNLTLLPGSLVLGPRWAWQMTLLAGYTALKVNPLRGWDVTRLNELRINVVGFEYLWRTNLRASVDNLCKNHDWMGFIADTCFIGYTRAIKRCSDYATTSYAITAPLIDFPAGLNIGQHILARETECSPEKWPLPLDDGAFACLDTWHIRSYPNPNATLDRLVNEQRVALIDIQTRDVSELETWIRHPRSTGTLLGRQLQRLSELPNSVSASVEIAPQHILILRRRLSLSYEDVLHEIGQAVRLALN